MTNSVCRTGSANAFLLLMGLSLTLSVFLFHGAALGSELPEATEEVLSTYPGVQVTFFEPPGVYTAFWGAPMAVDSSPEEAASAWLTAHASAFGVDDPDLRLVRSNVVGTGRFTVFAYQQFINDLPVIPSMARILILNGAEDRVVYAATRSPAAPLTRIAPAGSGHSVGQPPRNSMLLHRSRACRSRLVAPGQRTRRA